MTTELTVIDPTSTGAAAAIDAACRSLGFFRVPLDVIDRSIAEAAWDDARAFFALPEEQKRAVEFPEPGYPYGYSPFGFETLAASIDEPSPPDLKESFSVGPDCSGDVRAGADEAEQWLRSPSLWPSAPPTLRASWSAYYLGLAEVARQLLGLMATALDLQPSYFEPFTDRHTSALRGLRYPALTDEGDDGPPGTGAHGESLRAGAHREPLRAGAHSDYGTLTILRTDEVPGLEVQRPDGTWAPVAPESDTFIVNLGDSIAQWTNDRWRSTVHRVTTASSAERHAMAFFHMANWDAVIECLPTCLADGELPRHQPVTAGPWLMEKFARTIS